MMWTKIRPYLGFSAVALAVGGLSALLTQGEMEAFSALRQPPLSPPEWVFPVAWTILYLLMGIGMGLVWRMSEGEGRRRAVVLWSAQLLVNFVWPILFFVWEMRLLAFFWLLLLLVLVGKMVSEFEKHSPLAAKLQIPYILWLIFAGYLNLGVYFLNR